MTPNGERRSEHGERPQRLGLPRELWLGAGRYLVSMALANTIWEFAQMPLYTLFADASVARIVFSALHCSAGDVMIAGGALVAALVLAGGRDWPGRRFVPVALSAVAFGLAYTVWSEWVNVDVRGSWAYSNLMPVVSVLGLDIGVSPLLQWLVLPALSFICVRRGARAGLDP